MKLPSFLGGSRPEPPEPDLPPELLKAFRRRSKVERRRLLQKAHDEATLQANRYGRDYQASYNAYLDLELSGGHQQLLDAANALQPSTWRDGFRVVVGQDDPPAGAWGWMLVVAKAPELEEVTRVPVSFATADEARAAGERAAAELWEKTTRRWLAGR